MKTLLKELIGNNPIILGIIFLCFALYKGELQETH